MILAAIIIAKNPAQYGFDIAAAHRRRRPKTSTLPGRLDLRRVAEWTGVPVDDIQQLNPELRRWTTPIREVVQPEVPAGHGRRRPGRLTASAPEPADALQWHTVKSGESLVTIARKLRVSRNDLAEANYLTISARVRPGQRLVVPRMPAAALLARAAQTDDGTASAAVVTAEVEDVPATVYRVRAGDTLFAIARRHGATVDQLKQWNNLKGSALSIGARLVVQPARTANAQQ